ncbi:hypothetical protein AVEN_55413-1, partial [Araneus ventricosus]
MQQNYQDSMAMVRKFGKPDLFLTFTCNPSWSEILNSMEGVQRPEDRPDIIVRIFNMKLKELLEDICKHGIFGTVLAYIYVIEFQKRGLPHAHILLTLDSESKISTKDDIDKFVSAELPDPCTDLRLFQIVTKCMVQGSCGTININSPCMRDGQCCKSFPKQFKDDTEENVNGYPIYRRRATEPVQVGKYSIDNRWVVPYNPWLLKKFNAHINVEVCASVKSVKYLYKYVYKGHDAASVKIQKEGALDHDEILSFVEGRYVSAPEAMWRLNEFNLSHKSHTVVRLAVHLPQQQPIVYQDGQEAQAIERAALRKTILTSWFELNKNDPSAHISYSYIPVILRGSRTLTVASSLKKHALWLKFHKLYLTKNMRALESERDFGAWLLDIGEKKSGSTIQLPLRCYPSIQDLIHQLYSDIDFSSVTPQELKDRAILTVNNERSMEINNKVLEFMPGNETVYKAVDMIMSEDPQDQVTFPEEFLNSLTPTGLPPYELKLKIGCIVMLLRNLAPSKGLCNGTRLIITKLQQNIIQAKSIDGTETFLIP